MPPLNPGSYPPQLISTQVQPNTYNNQPPQQDNNPYGFFMDQQQTSRRSFGGGMSVPAKIALLFFGVGGLVVGMIMMYALVFKAPDNKEQLTAVANEQQELIRISRLATFSVDSDEMQNFSNSAFITMSSAQVDLLTHLRTRNIKLDAKKLTASMDPQSDQALKAAEAANTYDATYGSLMQEGLTDYQNQIQQAFKLSPTQAEKDLLTKQHKAAGLLLRQLALATP